MFSAQRATRGRLRSGSVAGLILLAVAPGAHGDDAEGHRFDRIAGLCRVWTAAKYEHPALADSNIDWDSAFATAALAVDGAAPVASYREVAAAMLGALGDPTTALEPAASVAAASPPQAVQVAPGGAPATALVRPLGAGVVGIDFSGFHVEPGKPGLAEALEKTLKPAMASGVRGVVVDLRAVRDDSFEEVDAALTATAPLLVPRAVQSPGARSRTYHGYPPQRGDTSGGYYAAFETRPGTAFTPASTGGTWRLVFLVGQSDQLPELVWAMAESGDAQLVATHPLDDQLRGLTVGIPLAEGVTARVRAWELLGRPLSATIVQSRDGDGDPALAEALRLLDAPWEVLPPARIPEPPAPRPEKVYAEPRLPGPGMRLLAACRAWGVIRYFYPYLGLIGDWDGAFRASLPAFLAAADEDAYGRAVLGLMVHVADGHTGVTDYPAIDRLFGEATPPLSVAMVEGQVAVVGVGSAVHDVRLGDVVRSVDGEPTSTRVARMLPLIAASTEGNHQLRGARAALRGPKGSKAVLELASADGKLRRVEVARVEVWSPEQPAGKPWRRLPPRAAFSKGVGYVDLNWLQRGEVEAMLRELGDTDALVLDMRGYPHGTAWPLAARLNTRGEVVAAQFRGRLVGPASFTERDDSGFFFAQPLPIPVGEPYRGRVVMLVDERSQSQAEHTALFLEQAAGAVFVGSPTSGANGDVTYFPLPGGAWVRFGGHDVRHADGRQLQRMGIQPEVRAQPTLAGLRAHRDEVLERALTWLDEHPR
jgi:C-terminal processing protease CtpA/Prc